MSIKNTFIRMNSTRNVAPWDRAIRGLLPLIVGGLWWAGVIPGVVAIPVGVVSLMLFPTAFTGACSIYYLLGFSTCPVSGKPNPLTSDTTTR